MKSRYRFKFSKQGRIKFIGHLDLMRVFLRATKRAGLIMAYSQGFNPHQLLSIAVPLPLGMESLCEVIEISLEEQREAEEIIERMNRELPKGIELISGRLQKEGEKNAASIAAAAEYEIILDSGLNIKECIEDILRAEQLIAMKKTKTQEKETNIRGDIFKIEEVPERMGRSSLRAVLSAGSGANLKPELLAREIYRRLELEMDPYKVDYLRTGLLELKDGKLSEIK